MNEQRIRLLDDALLDRIASRHELRRLLVVATARGVLVLAGCALATAVVFLVGPTFTPSAWHVAGYASLFCLGAALTHTLNQHKHVLRELPWLRVAAPLVQAAFYTAYIAGALFVFVLQTRLLFSSLVTMNLFGLLFWQFRRRLEEEDEPADAGRSAPPGRGV